MHIQDTGVGFYRILQPVKFMKREGLVKEARSMPFSGEAQGDFFDYPDELYMRLCKDTDVVISTLLNNPDKMLRWLNLRKKWGFKLIYDMDDNIYAVSNDNPVVDTVNKLRTNFEVCLRACDGLTVSVPNLKRLYSKLNDNIYVNPNGLDFGLWDKLKTKKSVRKIRIGWRGAYGHKEDLEMILPVMKAIQKDYPNVEFVTFGWSYPQRFWKEHHEWVSLFDYPNMLSSLDLDIAVFPLMDSAYNRCKSNLAYLEYSALKIPTVLTPTENQKGMVALEARSSYEWYQALEKLIKDKKYRLDLGQKAYDHAKGNYNIQNQVHPLHEWMKNLSRRKDLEPNKK